MEEKQKKTTTISIDNQTYKVNYFIIVNEKGDIIEPISVGMAKDSNGDPVPYDSEIYQQIKDMVGNESFHYLGAYGVWFE